MMYLGKDAIGLATSIPEFANIAKIECGNYIPKEDTLVSQINFNHDLKDTPDCIYVYADPINNNNNWDKTYMLISISTIHPIPSQNTSYIIYEYDTKINTTIYNAMVSTRSKDEIADFTSFKFGIKSSNDANLYLKANITYHYVIGKFKEVTSNANE